MQCPEIIAEYEASCKSGRKRKRIEGGSETSKTERLGFINDLVSAVINAADSESIYASIIRAHHNLTWKNRDPTEKVCRVVTTHDMATERSCKRTKVMQQVSVRLFTINMQ